MGPVRFFPVDPVVYSLGSSPPTQIPNLPIRCLVPLIQVQCHIAFQLVLTVGLLAVVVYLYTVVAFNFFRKFYNKSEDGDTPDMKCDDMLTCYMFHMYVGVRAGGGIGDEIEDPAGDEYEIYRIIFDITFFFFVIVILLAIIQGKHRPQGSSRTYGV
nr:ryanodine receptor 2-like [Loxodonta africana]